MVSCLNCVTYSDGVALYDDSVATQGGGDSGRNGPGRVNVELASQIVLLKVLQTHQFTEHC